MNKRPRRPTGETRNSNSDKPKFVRNSTGKPDGKRDFKKADGDKRSSSSSTGGYRGKPDADKKPFGKKDYSDKRSSDKPDFDKKPYGKRTDTRDFRSNDSESSPRRGKFDKPAGKREFSDKREFDKPRGEKRDFPSKPRGKFDKPTDRKDFSDKRSADRPDRRSADSRDGDSKNRFDRSSGKRDFTDKRDFDKPRGEKRDYSSKPRGKFDKPTDRKDFSDKREFDKPRGEKRTFPRAGDGDSYSKSSYSKKPYPAKGTGKTSGTKKDWDEAEPSTDVRLNRYISNSGICSRREADELIKDGKVTVNKIVVTEMGFKVTPKDVVRYEGKVLTSEKLQYVLLNKPKGFITTMKDDRDRKTVMSLIEKACDERIYPVGRLDRNTTGLLLFTNDGDLTKKLTHPSHNVKKIYQVTLDKPITQAHFDQIIEGLQLEDGPIKVDELAILSPDNLSLGIEIHSGKNRIIRRIFEHFEYQVEKLDRVMIGNLTKKNLKRGDWRHLTPQEVSRL